MSELELQDPPSEQEKAEMLASLDFEISTLERELPWYEEQGLTGESMSVEWANKFLPLLKEGLRICREQRFDLLTYGALKKRY